jgi:hypothetical protein
LTDEKNQAQAARPIETVWLRAESRATGGVNSFFPSSPNRDFARCFVKRNWVSVIPISI